MMGLTSLTRSLVQKVTTAEQRKKVVAGTNVALSVLANPIKTIINPKKAIEETSKTSGASLVAQSALNAAVVAAPLSSTIRGAAGTLIKAVTPSTLKGKVAAAIITPVVAGAVIAQPKKAAETLINAPSELSNFGGDAANLLVNPSLKNAKELVTESPIITGTIAAAGLVAVGKTVAPLVSNYITTKEMKKQTKAFEEQVDIMKEGLLQTDTTSSYSGVPLTPATQVIGKSVTTSTKRSLKKVKKQVQQPVKQSVRINILTANQSRIGMKSYLN